MRKKILFISPLPPPHYGSAMSSEMCLDILKNAKAKSQGLDTGNKTKDITLEIRTQKSNKLFEVRNIKLNYSKNIGDVGRINIDKIKGLFSVRKQIRKEIREFNPDIVYFVPATYSFGLLRDWFFVREIKKYWKGKILFHIRSRILDKTWNSFLGRKLLRDIYQGNKAIVLGKELINDLREIIPKKDVEILPNAIKNEISESELKVILKERKKNKHFNILFLSNMDRSKGWIKVLDACRILNNKGFDFECNFVGDWVNHKDKKYFNDFVIENKLGNRVFARGKKTGEDKNEFLKKANALVFPTEKEAFGKVLLEAYMFAVPVIGNSEGAIPSIIKNKKTGFLLEKNTGEEIAEKILNGRNWEKMEIEGRRMFLEKFELDGYGERFLGLF